VQFLYAVERPLYLRRLICLVFCCCCYWNTQTSQGLCVGSTVARAEINLLLGAVTGGNVGVPFSLIYARTHARTHIHTTSLKHQMTLEKHSSGIDKSISSIILIRDRNPNSDCYRQLSPNSRDEITQQSWHKLRVLHFWAVEIQLRRN
jgi:hypothetical protein